MIDESQPGFQFPQLNSILVCTFSEQSETSKKIPIDIYIFEI